jgi:hypothetical protein
MKKIAVFLLLIAASTQLKAQQLLQPQPNLKLNDGLQNAFKPATTLTSQQMLIQAAQAANNTSLTVYSTMPVVKVSSVDHMPILVPNEQGIKYTMLVKKVEIINPNEPGAKPLIP